MTRIEGSFVQLGNSYVLNNSASSQISQQENQILQNAQNAATEIINSANEEASKIVEAAQLQVQEMIQQAQEAIQHAQEEAQQAGYQEGYDNGQRQIHADLTNQIKSVDVIARSSFDVKKQIIASSETEILKLTIAIAEKVIRKHLEIEPEIILNIVKSAINELKDKEEVKILVNPLITEHIYNFSDELKHTIKGLKSIKIIEDRTIPPDGTIVESPESRIDARLHTQIEEIAKQLLTEAQENPIFEEIPKEIEIKIEEPKEFKE